MKCNVGKTDRIIRLFAGLLILGIGIYYGSWWGLIGFLPILTAVISWCSLYALIGISTCREDEEIPKDTSTE